MSGSLPLVLLCGSLSGVFQVYFLSPFSDIMDYFLAGEDQQQTNQPNDLAGG